MRWRAQYVRVVKRFAIFPIKTLAEGEAYEKEYRWLETVYLVQDRDWLFGVFPIWKNRGFISKQNYDNYVDRNKLKQETKTENATI